MAILRELPPEERPRERLFLYGPQALSHAELLAILLRTGRRGESALALARRLLARFGGLGGLMGADLRALAEVEGIGPAKAAQVLAALELGRRAAWARDPDRPQILSSADAARLLVPALGGLPQEQFWVLLLDTRHRVVGRTILYQGSVDTTLLRTAEVFREAVRRNCPAVLVAHNHPSGDPSPSPEDRAVTEDLVRAAELLDIRLLDHLVVGRGRYVSLRERWPELWGEG